MRQVHHVQLIELQPHVQVEDLNPVRYRFQSVLLIQHEVFSSSLASLRRSDVSISSCDLTEIYSPAAIDVAPEINPAIQVINKV